MSAGPLKTLFDTMNAKGGQADKVKSKSKTTAKPGVENSDPIVVSDTAMQSSGAGEGGPPVASEGGAKASSKSSNKRLSVERIYQKKSQLEHILLRPDTYIGSVESTTQAMWVMDEDNACMVLKDITYVPGLYKIFDEILVNAADNKQRDPGMNCIKIEIDPEANMIKIWNNGKGIPVVIHQDEKMFVPTMIFGHLLTSSNYDDADKKVTGGRNGYGAKLCNIFSNKFIVETSCKDYKKSFKQTWSDNMTKTKEASIKDNHKDDFTAITFFPDLTKFKMEKLDEGIVALFTRRAYDIAAASKGVRVFLNGKRLPVKNFREYIDLFLKDKVDDNGQPLKVVHEVVNDRWEVAITLSEKGFQQSSFVNSIATTKGGRHVDYVTDQVVTKFIEIVKKKNKGGVKIKPFQVKNHLWVFVNCLIENPTFDSQTKENMTLQLKSFGSKCQLTEKFVNQASKCGIVEGILSWMKFKAQSQLNTKCYASKHSKLKGIPKLDDANDAGTKNSQLCTLVLTEGDSAKSLAVAGLGVIGRDRYGVFPLRGKLLNVREATHKQIMDNAEINSLIKIMGLQFKEKYENVETLRTLRYGKIMIMTDQDQDGSHIKGLVINFIHHFWPNLLKHNIVQQFITPIVKVSKSKTEHSFYSLPEFEEWKRGTENWHTWKIKYYKGLGTSTSKEAKEYFSDMQRHKILFKYSGTEDDASIMLAFSKKKVDDRKQWLTNYMEERKRRLELGLPELYLYGKETKNITFNDFVNRELVLFSNTDNVRSIPSLMDGLKPGQRKVIFTCFKRNDKKEVKVAQLAGSVAELSAYHHGEASLMGTIVNLAQNFVGSNNINLLQPIGQFGTRIHGGKDAASPRYIFTMLSPLARCIFPLFDDPLLNNLFDDNLKIEPEWYCPIIPTVLVNGAEGIGTGWSTRVPNYDPRVLIKNIQRMLDGEAMEVMEPLSMFYKNYRGSISELGDNRYILSGEISIVDDRTIEITELPVRMWTQNYKEEVLEPMLYGTEKTPAMITDYKEYHTDTTVKFIIKMDPTKLMQVEQEGLHKVFKIQSSQTYNAMVLFDHSGCIHRYNSAEEILQEFYTQRFDMYIKRKAYLEGMLSAESLRLDNIARFILEKIEGVVVVENKLRKEIIQILVRRGYDSDPVKAWKEAQNKKDVIEDENEDDDDAESDVSGASGPDFNYLLGMALWSLTRERKDELIKQKEAKSVELRIIQRKSPTDLWREDLDVLLVELEDIVKTHLHNSKVDVYTNLAGKILQHLKVEEKERQDELVGPKPAGKSALGALKGPKTKKLLQETLPSPQGRRVEPRIASGHKLKAQKDAIKKLKKDKKDDTQKNLFAFFDKGGENGDEDEASEEPLSLADRIKGTDIQPIKEAKVSKPRIPRVKAASGSGSRAKAGPVSKKNVKKRNPWESDSEDNNSDMSDMDVADDIPDEVRNFSPRRAAAKPKYRFESEDEDLSDLDNPGVIEARPTVVVNGKDSDDDDDSFNPSASDEEDTPAPKQPSVKKTAPKKAKPADKPAKRKLDSDSSDDNGPPSVTNGMDSEKRFDEIFNTQSSAKTSTVASSPPASSPPPSPKTASSEVILFDSDRDEVSDDSDKESIVSKPRSTVILDSDEEDYNPGKKPSPKKKAASKTKEPTKKAPQSTAASKPKAPPKPRVKKTIAIDSDMSEDEKPKKKSAAKRPAKQASGSDSDEFVPKKKKSTAAKKKSKMTSDDDDFEVDDFASAAVESTRGQTGRARKATKYTYDDEDEDDNSDDFC